MKEKELKGSPEGVVNVHYVNGRTQFYFKKTPKDKTRKYMKVGDKKLALRILQRDYDKQVLELAKKELHILSRLDKVYSKASCDQIYERLSPHRRKLITPIYLPDEEFIKQWEEEELEPVRFREDSLIFTTDKGERVRSKSEILIANALHRHNIPYRYEQPLRLKAGVTIHPDFTILNVKKRKTIYYEHFGIMDDPQYVENFLKKMETYMENGIFPGDQLIFTFESGKYPINQNTLKLLINQYLK